MNFEAAVENLHVSVLSNILFNLKNGSYGLYISWKSLTMDKNLHIYLSSFSLWIIAKKIVI